MEVLVSAVHDFHVNAHASSSSISTVHDIVLPHDLAAEIKSGNVTMNDISNFLDTGIIRSEKESALNALKDEIEELHAAKEDAIRDLSRLYGRETEGFEDMSTRQAYERSNRFRTAMNKLFEKYRGHRLRVGQAVIVITSVTVLLAVFDKHREEMSGCWRFVNGDEKKKCKVIRGSCAHPNLSTHDVACTEYPGHIFTPNACRDSGRRECVHCDSGAEPGTVEYLDPKDYTSQKDVYRCVHATVWDAIGKASIFIPGDVAQAIKQFSMDLFGGGFGIIIFAVFVLIFVYYSMSRPYKIAPAK